MTACEERRRGLGHARITRQRHELSAFARHEQAVVRFVDGNTSGRWAYVSARKDRRRRRVDGRDRAGASQHDVDTRAVLDDAARLVAVHQRDARHVACSEVDDEDAIAIGIRCDGASVGEHEQRAACDGRRRRCALTRRAERGLRPFRSRRRSRSGLVRRRPRHDARAAVVVVATPRRRAGGDRDGGRERESGHQGGKAHGGRSSKAEATALFAPRAPMNDRPGPLLPMKAAHDDRSSRTRRRTAAGFHTRQFSL